MQSNRTCWTAGNLLARIKTSMKQNTIFLQLSLQNAPRKNWQNQPSVNKQVSKPQIVTNCFSSHNKECPHAHAEIETHLPTDIYYDQTPPKRDRVQTHFWNAESRAQYHSVICLSTCYVLEKHFYLFYIVMRTFVCMASYGEEVRPTTRSFNTNIKEGL